LTTDHTVAQRVSEGSTRPVDPTSHLHHVLWNSLGGSETLPKPEIVRLDLQLGDVLLLCSDGLTKYVSDDQLTLVLAADEPNTLRCAKLVELANAQGGSDNVTVVLASARNAAPPNVVRAATAPTLQM
jgi:serine/threonine protein phosphatase PrpC